MKFISILICALFILSCNKSDKTTLNKDQLLDLKKNVISKNDPHLYVMLLKYYSEKDNYFEILPYSIIVATKFNNGDAYLQVYMDIIRINNNGKFKPELINNLDINDREFALNYLHTGALNEDMDCKVLLMNHYKFKKNWKAVDSLKKNVEKIINKSIKK